MSELAGRPAVLTESTALAQLKLLLLIKNTHHHLAVHYPYKDRILCSYTPTTKQNTDNSTLVASRSAIAERRVAAAIVSRMFLSMGRWHQHPLSPKLSPPSSIITVLVPPALPIVGRQRVAAKHKAVMVLRTTRYYTSRTCNSSRHLREPLGHASFAPKPSRTHVRPPLSMGRRRSCHLLGALGHPFLCWGNPVPRALRVTLPSPPPLSNGNGEQTGPQQPQDPKPPPPTKIKDKG